MTKFTPRAMQIVDAVPSPNYEISNEYRQVYIDFYPANGEGGEIPYPYDPEEFDDSTTQQLKTLVEEVLREAPGYALLMDLQKITIRDDQVPPYDLTWLRNMIETFRFAQPGCSKYSNSPCTGTAGSDEPISMFVNDYLVYVKLDPETYQSDYDEITITVHNELLRRYNRGYIALDPEIDADFIQRWELDLVPEQDTKNDSGSLKCYVPSWQDYRFATDRYRFLIQQRLNQPVLLPLSENFQIYVLIQQKLRELYRTKFPERLPDWKFTRHALKIFVTNYQEMISVADIVYEVTESNRKLSIDSMAVAFLGWPVHFQGSTLRKLLE
jgi:hypothetical protein